MKSILALSREKISELENEISRLLEENKKVEKERNEVIIFLLLHFF